MDNIGISSTRRWMSDLIHSPSRCTSKFQGNPGFSWSKHRIIPCLMAIACCSHTCLCLVKRCFSVGQRSSDESRTVKFLGLQAVVASTAQLAFGWAFGHGVAIPGVFLPGCHGYTGGMCGSNVYNTLLDLLGRLQGIPGAVLASRRSE